MILPDQGSTMQVLNGVGARSKLMITAPLVAYMRRCSGVEPLGCPEFLDLSMHTQVVLTGSGSTPEETIILGVLCQGISEKTERPIAITQGTNRLVGIKPGSNLAEDNRVLAGEAKSGRLPELWHGHPADHIVAIARGHPA